MHKKQKQFDSNEEILTTAHTQTTVLWAYSHSVDQPAPASSIQMKY